MLTAFYCRTHDQGALVSGDHDVLPPAVDPCVTCRRRCDYRLLGRVDQSGPIGLDLSFNYDRFGGGWELANFATEVYEPDGRLVECPAWLTTLLS